MPERFFAAQELAKLLGVLSHPYRIRIIEELRVGELDVNTLQGILGGSHSRVSQQLAVLRSHRLVSERREGRHVYYRATQPRLSRWLLEGLEFVQGEIQRNLEIREAVEKVRTLWGDGNGQADHSNGHRESAGAASAGTSASGAETESGTGQQD